VKYEKTCHIITNATSTKKARWSVATDWPSQLQHYKLLPYAILVDIANNSTVCL